ncbi:MAG: glutathione peroxidase [Neisseriaceae bacterium]
MKNSSIYDFKALDIDGKFFDFNILKGKVLIIVNTASKCGFTKQYAELEKLYKTYYSKGIEIIAFPCNQFHNQEPGDESEIKQFCKLNYDISFKLMQKIDVNGKNTHPIYNYLKHKARGIFYTTKIKWNFTKFLINRDGTKVIRYAPIVNPSNLTDMIQKLLLE